MLWDKSIFLVSVNERIYKFQRQIVEDKNKCYVGYNYEEPTHHHHLRYIDAFPFENVPWKSIQDRLNGCSKLTR